MVFWLQTELVQPQSWKHLWELQGPMNRSRNFCCVFEAQLASRKEASLWVVSMSCTCTLQRSLMCEVEPLRWWILGESDVEVVEGL